MWHGMFGGERPYWHAYTQEAARLGFGDAPVYIATGAWESNNQTLVEVRHVFALKIIAHYSMQGVRRWGNRFGTTVFHKGLVLPATVRRQLNTEQLALVELLILVRTCGAT